MQEFDYTIEFASFDSPDFNQVIDLRYQELYQDANLPKDVVLDASDEISLHCVIKNNTKIIGYGRLTPEKSGDGKISQMAVSRDFQRKGLGGNILGALIDKAREVELKRLYMTARTSVIDFYTSFGFHASGDVFISPRTKIPHVMMEAEL